MKDDTHEGPQRRSHLAIWIAILTLLGIVVLLATVPVVEHVRTRMRVRKIAGGLHGGYSVFEKTKDELLTLGASGRLALLDALGKTKYDDDLRRALLKAIHDDVEAGRDVKPVVRAAAEMLQDGGPMAECLAFIAAEGWPLGLLDDAAKQAIMRQFLRVELVVRPEYPLGKGCPALRMFWRTGESTVLRFGLRWCLVLDGEITERKERPAIIGQNKGLHEFGARARDVVSNLGRHTIQGKAEVELVEFVTDGKFEAREQPGWKTVLETETAEFAVRDDLPPDFLQVKVTPEVQQKVAQCAFTLTPRDHTSGDWRKDGAHVVIQNIRYLSVDPPFPVDLAFSTRWIDAATGKEWTEGWRHILKGEQVNESLVPPRWVADGLPPGKHSVTFRVIFEPNFDVALSNPSVEAYWPLPIELPPVKYEIEVKAPKTE